MSNQLPGALAIGIKRGGLELKQFFRQRESVVFTLLFPLILLAIFGSVFSNTIAPNVTFSQYFVAGMIASALVNTGFQQLAIFIPVERDLGGAVELPVRDLDRQLINFLRCHRLLPPGPEPCPIPQERRNNDAPLIFLGGR